MLEVKRFMFNIDMGGGKTLLTLMLLSYRKQRGEKPKAIVLCTLHHQCADVDR